jgi:twinkle protein
MNKFLIPDDIDFANYIVESEGVSKIVQANAWRDEVIERLNSPEQITGAKLPWGVTHDNLRFRTGEVTLWQGINGHGKSQLLGMAALGFMAQGESVCIASFEMRPLSTIMRMLRQCAMTNKPATAYADKILDWFGGKFWLYNQLGTVSPAMIYGVIRYCSKELKIKHIIVDSLMKCVKGEDDYNGQKDFIAEITTLAREFDVHVHVVHHVRKSDTEEKIPGKFDSKGSGAIADQVDQVLTVWRNKKKERILQGDPTNSDALSSPDAMLSCDKNRHGEWEGRVPLWFNPESLQYSAMAKCRGIDMMTMKFEYTHGT